MVKNIYSFDLKGMLWDFLIFLKKNKKEETAAETQEDIRQEEYAEEEVAAGSENKAEDKVTEP